MTDLDIDGVLASTRAVLESQKHALDELTQRKTRSLVEQDLKLEAGALDTKEYKDAIKKVVMDFIESHPAQSSPPKPKPAAAEPPPAPAPAQEEPKPKPKPKPRKSKADDAEDAPAKPTKKRKRVSAKTVDSDDELGGGEVIEVELPKPAKKAKPSEKPGPTEKAFGQFMGLINAEMQRDMARDAEAEAAVSTRANIVTEFDSDVSSVIDQSPIKKKGRKRKSKSQDPESKPGKAKRGKKPAVELDKNEEEIKRLKSFVVACGVRKQWAREFKGMDKPSQQIAHLRKMLADLGMTGRLSLEKAKGIRAQRELQQEIQDVVEFDRKRGSGAKPLDVASEPSEDEDEEEEEHVKPAKKLQHSIAAFLADQSDDE
ncbi:hypothetical protein AURDEDRAFT_136462 [Auricularia subglabra TFB-10046 SS5]|nr:hypothetical protein AURDEDRAFT_136462 [Auricularia subglabra TFB-10046 SS5]